MDAWQPRLGQVGMQHLDGIPNLLRDHSGYGHQKEGGLRHINILYIDDQEIVNQSSLKRCGVD
jgi:hypothetical protein